MAVIDYTKSLTGDNGYSLGTLFAARGLAGKPLFAGNTKNSSTADDLQIIDRDWVVSRFMVNDSALLETDRIYKYYTTTNEKFVDTSLGGNLGINTKPQYTPYCDIHIGGRRNNNRPVTVNDRSGSHGLGRYYSEAIDDNAQLVYLEFGIPKFNSLFSFFTRAVSYKDSVLANTGRAPYGYIAGQVIGGVVMLAAFPLVTISVMLLKTLVGLVNGHGAFKYYYLDTTMHSYWGTVNSIVTLMATEMGVLTPQLIAESDDTKRIGVPIKVNREDMDDLRKLMPGIISDANYIDVFAVATKAQAGANAQALYDREIFDKSAAGKFDFLDYISNRADTGAGAPGSSTAELFNTSLMFSRYLDKTVKNPDAYEYAKDEKDKKQAKGAKTGEPKENNDSKADQLDKGGADDAGTYPAEERDDPSWYSKFVTSLDSGIRDGALHAIFRVDFVGSVTESFSNSLGEIDTGSQLKSLSKKSRDLKFSLSGGNLLGDTVTSAAGYAKDFLMGGLDSITFGGSNVLQTIMGGGYIDIPKKWEDSSVSLPQLSYKMTLISPYGNVMSRMTNIWIPLAMLMAGTLPQATGKAAYASPFICSLFTRGMQSIPLGMITNLSITRGVSNLPFDKNRNAMAVDVTFTVTDFSNILASPVNTSIFDNIFSVPFEDDNPFSNYIATLGSRTLYTQKYTMPKLKLRYSRARMNLDQAISPSSWGLRFGEGLNGILGGFVSGRSIGITK